MIHDNYQLQIDRAQEFVSAYADFLTAASRLEAAAGILSGAVFTEVYRECVALRNNSKRRSDINEAFRESIRDALYTAWQNNDLQFTNLKPSEVNDHG